MKIKGFIPKDDLKRRLSMQLARYIISFAILIPIFWKINLHVFCLNITYLDSAAIFFIATFLNTATNRFKTNVR
ncbi:hypothetical protein UFOVP639_26 [uncultured Caudovirales phage]|uniref:Uncharacterized protein n=1 Tax=uncultured Caudovirales phage TaxID=2100421 RepID=A0A6J5N9E8_9CAUD|nr:hypothetical protein UFOVP639_26 [uncultured Caudovirales phage]